VAPSVYVFTKRIDPLSFGLLQLVSLLTIECGPLTIRIRGNTLASVAGPTVGQLTSLTDSLSGNGEGTDDPNGLLQRRRASEKAKLEANFGAGFLETAKQLGRVTVFILQPGVDMFEIEQPNP
jgi:hypothetical protein